jgi:O-antigen ligase
MLRTLAAAIIVVCACGLITRVLPNVWHTSSDIANERLSFPVTYWNALGLLAMLGIVLCIHFSSEAREHWASRILGAAAVPVLATTLFFTFSRGAIATGVIAIVTYMLLGRPRALLSFLIAAVPTTGIALKFAYDANLLATPNPTVPAAVQQGHHVAIAVAACAVGAALLRAILCRWMDERLVSFSLAPETARKVRRRGWTSLGAAALILVVALNGTIIHQYHRFVRPAPPGSTSDLRTRLTDPGNNGRIEMWQVAWHQFKANPVVGKGAGTFADTFAQHRPTTDVVHDAHSIYMETLNELGIVGLVLLLTAIITVLARTAARARGPGRPLYAALFAVLLAWAIHAGIDWDWEMPVLTFVFFALGGFALSRPLAESGPQWGLAPRARTFLGLGCALLVVAPAYVWLSQRKLDDARFAFAARNCPGATRGALSSISILGVRAESYEILGYCDIRQGTPALAVRMIDKAISLDPNNWNYHYDLALARAAAGLDPRNAARDALSLNPLDPLAQSEWKTFRHGGPAQWEIEGKALADQFTTL